MPDPQNKRHFGSNCITYSGVLALVLIIVIGIMFASSLTPGARRGSGLNESDSTSTTTGEKISCGKGVSVPAEYMPWIKDASARWLGGNEAQLIALIQIESGWRADAYNDSGATGLGQYLLNTAKGKPEFAGGPDIKNSKQARVWDGGTMTKPPTSNDVRFNPERSIYAVAHSIHDLIEKWGDYFTAYERGYITWGDDGSLKANAVDARQKLETFYNLLIKSGACTGE